MLRTELSKRLAQSIAPLDIPEEIADDAVLEYQRVAEWLAADDSPLRPYELSLYPQGSFRLGTPVHPVVPNDDFDIDLVCQVGLTKQQVTQKELKTLIGDRLKASDEFGQRLRERRRCWTLEYPGRFHLDVLPTIPDPEHDGDGVLLTDKELVRWQFSNPIGFAEWFYSRMRQVATEGQRDLAKAAGASIDDIPDWGRVRTPLQRAVQLLKRHRDVSFATRPDDRPISVIITTLAGWAYKGQQDIATALADVVETIPGLIERRDGKWWVENPAHPGENFADKWNETPALRDAFLRWLGAIHGDITQLISVASDADADRLLNERLQSSRAAQPSGRYVAPGPESTAHAKLPPWPVQLQYSCMVDADVYHGIKKGKAIRSLGSSVHKRAAIRFEAVTDAPEPYDVQWQVTNTGAEARAKAAMRGEFYKGEGPNGKYRWESTLYAGTHFVQAFVVKSNRLVAKSKPVPVVIPAWTPGDRRR